MFRIRSRLGSQCVLASPLACEPSSPLGKHIRIDKNRMTRVAQVHCGRPPLTDNLNIAYSLSLSKIAHRRITFSIIPHDLGQFYSAPSRSCLFYFSRPAPQAAPCRFVRAVPSTNRDARLPSQEAAATVAATCAENPQDRCANRRKTGTRRPSVGYHRIQGYPRMPNSAPPHRRRSLRR